jgi:hypothetical protein
MDESPWRPLFRKTNPGSSIEVHDEDVEKNPQALKHDYKARLL